MEDDRGHHYYPLSIEIKTVAEYTGCDFDRIAGINIFLFWQYLRDAVIYNYMRTPEGNEYLADCERLTDTQPNRTGLRRLKGD